MTKGQVTATATRTLADLMRLSGRKALITGGTGHVGVAVGEALVELGATVAVLDVDAARCQERADALGRMRARSAVAIPCDLRDEQATRGAIHRSIEWLGGLDILVHCAAYVGTDQLPGWVVPFEQQTVDAWDAAMRVNLTSAFIMVQEARTMLDASGTGSVILIGSTYGLVGPDPRLYEGTTMGTPAGYAASKGGVLQLTRYLSTVLAPRVRVNAITPGGIWRNQPEAFHQRYVSRTPLGRMASEEDLKGAVAYLASDLSAYVTGQNLVVDGGWTAW
ncbi:MAG: SDR family oxidoreductase [Candidatus Omnitrophica bacterium]|nr:SDR family oxidoreductase [Candidatus Omnitrophota bacterium]